MGTLLLALMTATLGYDISHTSVTPTFLFFLDGIQSIKGYLYTIHNLWFYINFKEVSMSL